MIKKNNRRGKKPYRPEVKEEVKSIVYRKGMTVRELAEDLKIGHGDLIKKLMLLGVPASLNEALNKDTVELFALEFKLDFSEERITDMVRFDEIDIVDDESDLVMRPPVVTIMGHVDHGKTTLLDFIRNTHVVKGEAGGITQHIGAYQVTYNEQKVTFIDTPGHAAFTEMRARGAKITDIIVLVVDANDGVMPQTEEAIQHAQAAGCPIIVAVNKIDKPTANQDRVMEELSHFNLIPESWGGNTSFIPISALKGTGVTDLLEVILITAEMQELKANPLRRAQGTVIEAERDKGRGPTATMLVQTGTLSIGDIVCCGSTYGRIRSIEDETGGKLTSVPPAKAAVVTGLNDVPLAGDKFIVLADERQARDIASARGDKIKVAASAPRGPIDINKLFEQEDAKELNLIIKADVQGSLEAFKSSIARLQSANITPRIIGFGVGAIIENDINLAITANAKIIGFNVRPSMQVRKLASDAGIDILLYNIIYKALDDIKKALDGMLEPEYEEVVTGEAVVRELFKVSHVGTIAGCFVSEGVIERNSLVRLLRSGIVVYEGKMSSLRRFKDDVKEVKKGYECGITIDGFNDIKVGDVIEASIMKEVK